MTTILCSGDCHVWLGALSLCTCEAHRVAMYGFPASYNPFVPHAPQPTPAAPDVPLQQFKAAQEEGATHLSTDGKTAYDQRQYSIYRCFWDQEEKRFGGWWKFEGELPTDAVLLDKEQL